MQFSHGVAIVVLVLVTVAWVAVQSAWRRVFPEACSDPDVLAGRLSCHGSGCTKGCDRRKSHE